MLQRLLPVDSSKVDEVRARPVTLVLAGRDSNTGRFVRPRSCGAHEGAREQLSRQSENCENSSRYDSTRVRLIDYALLGVYGKDLTVLVG